MGNITEITSSDNKRKSTQSSGFTLNTISMSILWLLCVSNLLFVAFNFGNMPTYNVENILVINGFTLLIWTTVTFFSAIVSTFSRDYLRGFTFHGKFSLLSLGFTLSVMLLVASNHVVLLVLSWFLMGFFMAHLIGVDSKWGEAKEARNYALKFFIGSTALLGLGVLLLSTELNTFLVSDIIANVGTASLSIRIIASLCIITAAIIKSAIFPFHKWLLSAMTAPTPASAQMHAGFVNGSGILLALFASLLFSSKTLSILFVIGGLTAIVAQFSKLLQVTVKQKLACSTIAQMGFMIMQCGLGFFNAAIAHLILHGFYKAYLFFSSGETVEMTNPTAKPAIRITFAQSLLVLAYGIAGAALFVFLTGKGTTLDSSIFLTLIVAITVGQLTYNIVKEKSLNTWKRLLVPAALFIVGIGVYALFFNTVSVLMVDMPMTTQAIPLTAVHVIFGIIFLIGFFIMKLGGYQRVPWLYVKLLNATQPYRKTILTYKTKS